MKNFWPMIYDVECNYIYIYLGTPPCSGFPLWFPIKTTKHGYPAKKVRPKFAGSFVSLGTIQARCLLRLRAGAEAMAGCDSLAMKTLGDQHRVFLNGDSSSKETLVH